MNRSYYDNSIAIFQEESENEILAILVKNHFFPLEELQKNAWLGQIRFLKNTLTNFPNGHIFFEFSIPRMGKRVDVILLIRGIILVIEFKVGEKHYSRNAIEQVLDYALDLKNFHERSHDRRIIPILVATKAKEVSLPIDIFNDNVFAPIRLTTSNFQKSIEELISRYDEAAIDAREWGSSIYKPTPTIIEAAQALYQGHSVEEISRSDASAYNLASTSQAISDIIEHSKTNHQKSICFITGVPGSGKTLAGLNIANQRNNIDSGEHAVFLSGNGPLVKVLREALARNEVENISGITKKESLKKTSAFIQNIHHFRDDSLVSDNPPIEKVVIFDEAQRAWTKQQTNSFMFRKRGIEDFEQSEPEFLISVMDRHHDWAIIICLIGGGQEINTGEAGLPEWFTALTKKFSSWEIFVSNKLTDQEYTWNTQLFSQSLSNRLHFIDDLHLGVSVRSFRSEKVSELVKEVLDDNPSKANKLYSEIKDSYPITITRDLDVAKRWLREKARGSERIGILASSGASRLRPYGLHNKVEIQPEHWFLDGKDDVRSSYALEELATEFDIQGLELDWTCVAWDANFRYTKKGWDFKLFRGSKWQNINDQIKQQYLKNAYRVLLTRARQGMVIFIPPGYDQDITRQEKFYDPIFEYFLQIGLETI
ncbi:MAG: DUF2075 domain-containing protein [Chloroflexota bacterium]